MANFQNMAAGMRILGAALTALLLLGLGQAPVKSKPTSAVGVVALVDTGINPYHVTFRDNSPRAQKHPSTYIPGYPRDAVALRITLDEEDYWTAVRKDCERVWSQVEPGRLYWFPGTKIVGAISFQSGTRANCQLAEPSGITILDYGAHGTMVSSRAASVEYGACRECRIVMVQGFNDRSITWAANNSSWIDAQSNSWGPFLPLWAPVPTGLHSDPEFVRTVEKTARKHLAFWASGNGILTRFGVLGHPTVVDPRMTPSVVMVGGHDSGYVALWPDAPPHVVSDACDSWAAYHNQTDKSDEDVGGGTSGATPFVAGNAVRILMAARELLGDSATGVERGVVARGRAPATKGLLSDGKFTLGEWKELVFKTATPRPKAQYEDGPPCGLGLSAPTPVKWTDVPAGYPEFLHIGYGAVDDEAVALALSVLTGRAELPNRSTTDDYFELDAAARDALHRIYGGGL